MLSSMSIFEYIDFNFVLKQDDCALIKSLEMQGSDR